MSDVSRLIWCALVGLVRSRAELQAEIQVLRHQLNVLRRKSPKRVVVGNIDRLLFVELYCFSPKVLDALKILNPKTVLRWHRTGFRAYWRWKSRSGGVRPKTPVDVRQLIREMSVANPLWGRHGSRRTAQFSAPPRDLLDGGAGAASRHSGRSDAPIGSAPAEGSLG